eukprot:CAMPEP_0115844392 /NCGR_PEP_ID=MMETSP0287-20121206/8805_1 /TAXON_ID=412157 /ORGANISM="Chrysochromulina rotalis, Strain UIO044" /LENGTH=71 /DNA_ID=CAMNT_0003298117 /DNA_START=413 /DNA_END=626 /DNA_ORIENTATION=+
MNLEVGGQTLKVPTGCLVIIVRLGHRARLGHALELREEPFAVGGLRDAELPEVRPEVRPEVESRTAAVDAS